MITNANVTEKPNGFEINIVDCKISIGTINKTSTVYNKEEFIQTLQYNLSVYHQILQQMLYDRYVEELPEKTKEEYFNKCSKFIIDSDIPFYQYFNPFTTNLDEVTKRMACDAIVIFNALFDALQKAETTTEPENSETTETVVENVEETI